MTFCTVDFAAMTSLSQLETWSNDLAIAVKTLNDHCRGDGTASTPHLAITNVAPGEADRARRNILTIATRLQTLLAEPAEFIQHLARQVCHTRNFSVETRLNGVHRTNSSHV